MQPVLSTKFSPDPFRKDGTSVTPESLLLFRELTEFPLNTLSTV